MSTYIQNVLDEDEDDLELKDDLVERLNYQKAQVDAGERGEALEDVISRLGLD
jgi:hypothetical protein